MNYCDFGHDTKEEIRVLPYNSDGNILCCKMHYDREMDFRHKITSDPRHFPRWETLRIYSEALK